MWRLDVYDHTNTTLQGTLSEAHGVRFSNRLGTIAALTFTVDRESTADLALLEWRRVVRVYPNDTATDPIESFFVDDQPGELLTATELPSVTFQCPTLDAWLGTTDVGGAVVYPYGGLAGRQQDPRRFGPEALEFDDTAWVSPPSTDGTVTLGGAEVDWFTTTNRSLFRLVISPTTGFPGRMLLRASRRLEVRVYLDADRMLSKRDGQTGVVQFDVDYDPSDTRVVLIDVAGSGKVAWAWGEVSDDDDETLDTVHFSSATSGWRQLDDYTTYPGMTPGYIAKTLVEEAQARGALAGLSTDFDADTDSDNVAWSGTVAHSFAVGSKLGWVLEQITQFGYDWRVAPDGTLQMFDLLGSDLSATVDLDVVEHSRAEGHGIKATALLWLSAGRMDDLQVSSAVGRIEEAATFGTSESPVKLEDVAQTLLDELSVPRDPQRLQLSDGSPQPYDDFTLGDVVSFTGRDGSATGRVTEIVGVLEDADGVPSWSVTVDVEDGQFSRERARRVRDQLRETFAQTVGGRALLASPRSDGAVGDGSQVAVSPGAAVPATVTVEGANQEVVSGEWVRLLFDVILRQNLMDPTMPADEIPLGWGGTWHVHDVDVGWAGVDFGSEWLGGGARLRLLVDDQVVWPTTTEIEVTPDRGLPVPSMQVPSVPTIPTDVASLAVEVRQDSGETQHTTHHRMSVSLREPAIGPGEEGLPPSPSPSFPQIIMQGNRLHEVDQDFDHVATITGLGMTPYHFSWNRVGSRVAVVGPNQPAEFRVIDVAARTVETGWPEHLPESPYLTSSVSWSWDDSKIAVTDLAPGDANRHRLHVVDVATKVQTVLRDDIVFSDLADRQGGVSWEPGGDRLLWCPGSLKVVLPDGSFEGGWPTIGAARAIWSPDGTRIFVMRMDSTMGSSGNSLSVINAATKTFESGWPTIPRGASPLWPQVTVSPDGRYIAGKTCPTCQVFIIDTDTKTNVVASWDLHDDTVGQLAWSPDGRFLVQGYEALTDQRRLRVIDTATGNRVYDPDPGVNGVSGSACSFAASQGTMLSMR